MTTGRILARVRTYSSALILGCAATTSIMAAEYAYDVNVGVGHSDNIGRVSSNEQDETIAAAGLRFSVDQRSRRLEADAIGNFSYAEYLDDTFDSELLGNFAGTARFAIVPERLEWLAADNFGQTLNDPFAPATPDNRENINYFTTGPDVTFAFGSQTRLRLGARYSLATYEDLPLDFATRSGEAAIVRMLSPASELSLNVRAAQTDYDQAALNADYDQNEAFVRYDVTGARTSLALDLGYTEIERESVADKESGLLLRLDATRRLSASSTATLNAGREFSNSGSAFADMQGIGGIGLVTVSGRQTAQPFTNTYATLGWDFARQRTSMNAFVSWVEQSYDAVMAADQTLLSAGTQLRRELSPATSVIFHALYTQSDFQQPGADYDDLNSGLTFGWRISRSVSLNATYDQLRRSSDGAAGDSTENRVWLSLAYGRGTPRSAPLGPQFSIDQGLSP